MPRLAKQASLEFWSLARLPAPPQLSLKWGCADRCNPPKPAPLPPARPSPQRYAELCTSIDSPCCAKATCCLQAIKPSAHLPSLPLPECDSVNNSDLSPRAQLHWRLKLSAFGTDCRATVGIVPPDRWPNDLRTDASGKLTTAISPAARALRRFSCNTQDLTLVPTPPSGIRSEPANAGNRCRQDVLGLVSQFRD